MSAADRVEKARATYRVALRAYVNGTDLNERARRARCLTALEQLDAAKDAALGRRVPVSG